MLWPNAWPKGLPLAFRARPAVRNSSHVSGYLSPCSLNQSSRYVIAHEMMNCGTPIQRPPATVLTFA